MDDYELNTDKLIEGVYEGEYNPFNLPEFVYLFTFLTLIKEVEKGYRGGVFTLLKDSDKWKTAKDFRINIDFFSGAKTWQETAHLTELVFNADGTKKYFEQFKAEALKINKDYNINWLKTEQNSAFRVAQSAERWRLIESRKQELPYLQYVTVADDKVRPLHRAWDKIIKRVDDPFWNTHTPPNEFGCRCRVIQLAKGIETDLDRHLSEYNRRSAPEMQIDNLKNDSKVFNINPEKIGMIFGKGHPYFEIPDRFRKAQEVNFGFEPPKKPVRTKI